jgi:hypothetical protein
MNKDPTTRLIAVLGRYTTYASNTSIQEIVRLPLPDIHIATLEGADGTMPDDISANARSTRDNSIVINGHGAGPAGLALLMLVLGVVF